MTIIDQFITDNNDILTSQQMADVLGASRQYINQRKRSMKCQELRAIENVSLPDEIVALLKLIEERQTGWAVDVAKQRIKDLSKRVNQ